MNDKVVVITGASKGLGKVLAQMLLNKGAKVVISDKDAQSLAQTAQELNTTSVMADVTKEEDIKNLLAKTVAEQGKVDIWINNAGIWIPRHPVEETDMKRAHDLIEVNLFGTMYGSREALVQMKKQGFGMIVNIVSTSALQGRPLSSAYSASKHAAKGFTDSLREELRGQPIKVIGIYPGGMKTNLFDEKKPDDFDQYMTPEVAATKIIENLEKNIPEEELILKRPGQK